MLLLTEVSTVWQLVALAIFFGVLPALIVYLLRGQGRRAELRTGLSWTALSLPATLVFVLVVGVVGQTLGPGAVLAVVFVSAAVVAAMAIHRRRRAVEDLDRPPPVEEVREEYRFNGSGGALAGWGIPAAILVVGSLLHGQLAAGITLGLAALVAAVGLTIVFLKRWRRQREIIAEVELRRCRGESSAG